MGSDKGPFKLVDSHSEECENQADPYRNYDCDNYTTCLSLAAALNWDSFHCVHCTGTINNELLIQAKKLEKKDKLVGQLCNFN